MLLAPTPIRVPTLREAGILTLFGGIFFLLLSKKQAVPVELNGVMALVTGVGGGILLATSPR